MMICFANTKGGVGNHDSDSGEPTDEDLLLVSKHGSVYAVERPLSWTPHAIFRATTVSGGFLEWDVADGNNASHYTYSNNQMFGEIAEPDDSSFTGGIKILAPGMRVFDIDVRINVWLARLALLRPCLRGSSVPTRTP